jgi:hypothetical protein
VSLVSAAPELRVSDDFMAGLQSRLQGLEPAPARGAWVENVRALFRPRLLPAWGAAAGFAVLVIGLMIARDAPNPIVPPPSEVFTAATASHQNVAITALDPLADIGAANLAAHASADSGGDTETVF